MSKSVNWKTEQVMSIDLSRSTKLLGGKTAAVEELDERQQKAAIGSKRPTRPNWNDRDFHGPALQHRAP
jgi:hypothetical protein